MDMDDFDYLFSDKELDEVLSFVELQSRDRGAAPLGSLPIPISSSPSFGLQFQPRATTSGSQGFVPDLEPRPVHTPKEPQQGQLSAKLRTPSTSGASQQPPEGPSRAGRPPVQEKPFVHTSHSTVEKQRRDRINSLIDKVCCSLGLCIVCLFAPTCICQRLVFGSHLGGHQFCFPCSFENWCRRSAPTGRREVWTYEGQSMWSSLTQ
jgi:hypothetical protein